MPKRVSKNKARAESKPSASPATRANQEAPATAGTPATDTESEFSVPQKWEENEEENATASSGPASGARDGQLTEEAADTKSA